MNYPIKCVLLEDEPAWQKKMNAYLSEFEALTVLGAARTVDDAFKLIAEHHPQAAFMDIRLIGGTAFDLLDLLHRCNVPIPHVVMITAYPDYAIEVINKYSKHVVKFLTKPMLTNWQEKIQEAIEAITAASEPVSTLTSSEHPCYVKIQTGHIIERIKCADLVWLEVAGKGRIFVYTDTDRFLANTTLANFMENFPYTPILRISKTVAVSRDRIKSLDLRDKAVVIRYKQGVKSLYIGKNFFNEVKQKI